MHSDQELSSKSEQPSVSTGMASRPTKQGLVATILALDLGIGNLENQLKDLKNRQQNAENQLVDLMEEEGETSYTDEDGKKITRRDKMFVSTRRDMQHLWFRWLESIGRNDLIKTDFNKTSLNALIRKIVAGDENHPLPAFLDMENDVFFKHSVEIKLGRKSLRRAAADAGSDHAEQSREEF